MRYSQSEKMEIIRIVEGSEIGVVRTLGELGIPKSTFYKWYDRYKEDGYEGLAPREKQQRRFWNQLPYWERQRVVEIALERPELSPRELAHHITDQERWFISESTVYRILKSHGLVTSPAYIVMKASDSFKDKTTAMVKDIFGQHFKNMTDEFYQASDNIVTMITQRVGGSREDMIKVRSELKDVINTAVSSAKTQSRKDIINIVEAYSESLKKSA